MVRNIVLGNGSMLACFDDRYHLRDLFFPHVGQENHLNGAMNRVGIWSEGHFSWIPDGWDMKFGYMEDTLVSNVQMVNWEMELNLLFNDLVDFHANIMLRKITIKNSSKKVRELKIFFTHDFGICGNDIGDTAAYRPAYRSLLHYKGSRYFLAGASNNGRHGFDFYAAGKKGEKDLEGTWKDAEDGKLSMNPIAQGSVDSVGALLVSIESRQEKNIYYWICAADCWAGVQKLHKTVIGKGPETFFIRTRDYWKLWIKKEKPECLPIDKSVCSLYKRSLLTVRTQIDNGGAIIAANDSDIMQFNRDTYSYLWPRDGALVANALDLAGYPMLSIAFFNAMRKMMTRDGYFFHKYTATGEQGSSWHPWTLPGRLLPIQEDETALLLWSLWEHFERYRDIEFIKPLYKPLVKVPAEFLQSYRDKKTGLPLPSYDLWEERLGVHAFTVGAVYGGLIAASKFTEAFGELKISEEYRKSAEEIKEAAATHLFVKEKGIFARSIDFEETGVSYDLTADSATVGLFLFGMFEATDPKIEKTMNHLLDKLKNHGKTGGYLRYENDYYFNTGRGSRGNPWIISTLWIARYFLETGELEKVNSILKWTADNAIEGGILPEQLHPETGAPLSVSPLTWSHAEYVSLVRRYIERN